MAAAHDLGERVTGLTIAATPAVPLMDNPFAYASELTANAWRAALESTEDLALELEALTGSTDALAGALLDAVGAKSAGTCCRSRFTRISLPAFARYWSKALRRQPCPSRGTLYWRRILCHFSSTNSARLYTSFMVQVTNWFMKSIRRHG